MPVDEVVDVPLIRPWASLVVEEDPLLLDVPVIRPDPSLKVVLPGPDLEAEPEILPFESLKVVLVLEVLADGDVMGNHDEFLAPGQVMPGLDAAGLLALLEELLTMPRETLKRSAISSRVP